MPIGAVAWPHYPVVALSGRARRRARGFAAISRGLIAVGSGDARAAERSATEARRLLGDESMTLLLSAQAAQLSGDRPGAEAAFSRMLVGGRDGQAGFWNRRRPGCADRQ